MPRGNIKNLIPNSERTPKELKAMTTKGGIASGKARAKRKTLKEELLLLLSQGDTQEKISLALIQKALDGDVKAFQALEASIGEKPIDKVMVAEVSQTDIDEIESLIDDED